MIYKYNQIHNLLVIQLNINPYYIIFKNQN
jgi:hypothetical protein